jgi:hypothetical protein
VTTRRGAGARQLHPALSWDVEKAPDLAELAYRRFGGELVATKALVPLAVEVGFLRVAEGESIPLEKARGHALMRALWPLRGHRCGAWRFVLEQEAKAQGARVWWRVEPAEGSGG